MHRALPATFDTLIATVPIAVLTFDFDPNVQLFGDLTVRWGSIALVGVIIATLMLAGLLARAGGLRPDDVAFVTVGIVPGAVVGARLGYLIVHEQSFGSAPERLLDPSVGGLELGLAVVGGLLTGSYVASLLGPSVGRWLHIAALPVLFVLGAGKLTMILTGTGQGLPSDADWATAYLGPGPWGSLAPELPSHPAQLYEAGATVLVLGLAIGLLASGAFARRDGRLFLAIVAGWALARTVVAATWRDSAVLGPLIADQLLSLAIAGACVAILLFPRLRQAGDSPRGSIVRRPGRDASGPDELRGQG